MTERLTDEAARAMADIIAYVHCVGFPHAPGETLVWRAMQHGAFAAICAMKARHAAENARLRGALDVAVTPLDLAYALASVGVGRIEDARLFCDALNACLARRAALTDTGAA